MEKKKSDGSSFVSKRKKLFVPTKNFKKLLYIFSTECIIETVSKKFFLKKSFIRIFLKDHGIFPRKEVSNMATKKKPAAKKAVKKPVKKAVKAVKKVAKKVVKKAAPKKAAKKTAKKPAAKKTAKKK